MRALLGLALLLVAGPAAADPITIVATLSTVIGSTAATVVANIVTFVAANAVALATMGSFVYQNVQRRKAAAAARKRALASLTDRYAMTTMTDGPRQRVYGKARTGSDIIFKRLWGADDSIYTLLLSVAGHEVQAIDDVYFGDVKLTLDGSGWVQNDPWKNAAKKVSGKATVTLGGGGTGSVTLPNTPLSGSVSCVQVGSGSSDALSVSVAGALVSVSGGVAGTATVYYQYNPGASKMRVRKYLGGPSQDLSASLAVDFPEIGGSDRFAGDAMLRVDMYYSQDAYPQGVQAFSAVVRGAKVLDPRTSTTAYSENPALQALDWAMYQHGGGLSADQVDTDSFIAAANVSDISHTFDLRKPDGSSWGTLNDKLYRGAMVTRLEGDPTLVLAELCEAMGGRYAWSGSKLRVVAGAYRTPVLDIDESWFADGEIAVVPEPAVGDAVNTYRPTIADSRNEWIITPLDPLIASTYVTADGMELVREIELQAVPTSYHALHVCGVLLREARQGLTITANFKLLAMPLEVFDVVRLTVPEFGWAAKTFEVQSWQFTPRGSIAMTLKETNATIYDPDADFSDLGWSDNTNLPDPAFVPLVENLSVESATSALVDGSIITRTRVFWDASTYGPVIQAGSIEVQFVEATAAVDVTADWPNTTEAGGATETIINGLRTDRVYLFRARARTPLATGQWCTQVAYKIGGPPAASISGQLTKPVATVAAANDGTVASFSGAGGSFEVRRNTTLISSGVTYSVVSESGVDVSINSSTGAYTVASMSTDTGTAVFRAVYDGVTLDRGYSISKAKAGDNATPDVPPALPTVVATHIVTDPADATTGVQLQRDGDIATRSGASYTVQGRWWNGAGSTPGDSHHVRFTWLPGATSIGTGGGSWVALTSDHQAVLARSSVGSESAAVLIELSDDGGITVIATGTAHLGPVVEDAGP